MGQEIHPSGRDHSHPDVLQATWLLYWTRPIKLPWHDKLLISYRFSVVLLIMTNLVTCPLRRFLLSYYPRPNTFPSDSLQPLSVAALDKRTYSEVKELFHCAHKYLLPLMQPFQFTYLCALEAEKWQNWENSGIFKDSLWSQPQAGLGSGSARDQLNHAVVEVVPCIKFVFICNSSRKNPGRNNCHSGTICSVWFKSLSEIIIPVCQDLSLPSAIPQQGSAQQNQGSEQHKGLCGKAPAKR